MRDFDTVQSHYNTPHYSTDLDVTHVVAPWEFTKEL